MNVRTYIINSKDKKKTKMLNAEFVTQKKRKKKFNFTDKKKKNHYLQVLYNNIQRPIKRDRKR